MANTVDTGFNAVARPMIMQLQKAQKQKRKIGTGGRTYSTTPSKKAVKNGPPVGQARKPASWNPEKSPANKTGVNTEFEDYAPRGYYPPRNGETRVLEQVDYAPKIPTKKLHEKG